MSDATKEHIKKATVMVFTSISQREKGDTPYSSGSGYFINSTGLFITNNHVVDPTHRQSDAQKQAFHYRAGRLTWTAITDAGGENEKTWEAMVLYQNEYADQAILQAYDEDGNNLQTPDYLNFLPEDRLRERMKVWALGFPGGDQQATVRDKHPKVSITSGNVLQFPRTAGGRIRMIYTDVIARPGNSGGPMVDADGFLLGTVTLMTKPKGRDDAGGANYSALVPSILTSEFIRDAYSLGKIPANTDFKPFVSLLTDKDGRIDIPGFERRKDRDLLYFPDGDVIHGSVSTESITWDSPLGVVQAPTDAVAYVLSDDSGAELFLEGGNRISASTTNSRFRFKPIGGIETEHAFNEVKVLGFRTSGRQLEPVKGEAITFDSDVAHLVMSDVKGFARFDSKAGTLKIELQDIARIEPRDDDDQQVLIMNDGRRISGKFHDDELQGTIAATGMPIKFHLDKVKKAIIQTGYFGLENVAGVNLVQVMSSADRDVRKIAQLLESNRRDEAQPLISALLSPTSNRRLPSTKKEQVHLLEAVSQLRNGKYDAANKSFGMSGRAKDENVAAYASASVDVLKQFRDDGYTYQDQPLSDIKTFATAGKVLAEEMIQKVRDLLKDAKLLEGKKGEFPRVVSDVRKYEPLMKRAGVLGGLEADDVLVRLWQYGIHACEREYDRLDKEANDIQNGGNQQPASRPSRGGTRGGGAGMIRQRQLYDIQKQRELVVKTARKYAEKLNDYGFHIEDPDIQRSKDEKGEEEPSGNNP